MSDVIVFISNQVVKPGKESEYQQLYRKIAAEIEAKNPGTAANLAYASQDGDQMSIVIVFPDAQAMDVHFSRIDPYARQAFEFIQVTSLEIYGQPSPAVMEKMRQMAGSGVQIVHKPISVGGYIRLK